MTEESLNGPGRAPEAETAEHPARRQRAAGVSARETAYQYIKDKIIALEYKPGQALSEKRLIEELGLGRTPVREALIVLSASNMVVFRPQRGTFVAPIDVERMETEQFTRCAIEKEIVSLACRCMTGETVRLYEENLAAYRRCLDAARPDQALRTLQLDNEFHRIAFEAVGRVSCYNHMRKTMQHIERLRYLSVVTLDLEDIYQDHLTLSRVLAEGAAEQARGLMERHLRRFMEDLSDIRRAYPEYFVLG